MRLILPTLLLAFVVLFTSIGLSSQSWRSSQSNKEKPGRILGENSRPGHLSEREREQSGSEDSRHARAPKRRKYQEHRQPQEQREQSVTSRLQALHMNSAHMETPSSPGDSDSSGSSVNQLRLYSHSSSSTEEQRHPGFVGYVRQDNQLEDASMTPRIYPSGGPLSLRLNSPSRSSNSGSNASNIPSTPRRLNNF